MGVKLALFPPPVTGQLYQLVYWLIHHSPTSEMPTLLYNKFLCVLCLSELFLPPFSDCSFAGSKLFYLP